jgi:hypothetical protein
MSIASRHGKLRLSLEDPGTRAHQIEDLLTADIFGAYRYLPVEAGIGPLLASATTSDNQSLADWAHSRGIEWSRLSRMWLRFWPTLATKEPDIVLVLGYDDERARLAVLVEVKLHSDQHTIDGKSQVGFYGAAFQTAAFDDGALPLELPTLRPIVFITKHRDSPADELRRARREVHAENERGWTDVFWTSWPTAALQAIATRDRRRDEGAPLHELAILDDIIADLAERSFSQPRPLVSLPLPPLDPLPPSELWPRESTAMAQARTFATLHSLDLARIESTLRDWRP